MLLSTRDPAKDPLLAWEVRRNIGVFVATASIMAKAPVVYVDSEESIQTHQNRMCIPALTLLHLLSQHRSQPDARVKKYQMMGLNRMYLTVVKCDALIGPAYET